MGKSCGTEVEDTPGNLEGGGFSTRQFYSILALELIINKRNVLNQILGIRKVFKYKPSDEPSISILVYNIGPWLFISTGTPQEYFYHILK